MLARYAQCEVHSHHDDAAAAVLAARRWTDHRPLLRVSNGHCSDELARYRATNIFDQPLAALAQALVVAEFGASGPPTFADRAPLAQPPSPDPGARHDVYAIWRAAYSRLGECVARAAPIAARAWLVTDQEADAPPAGRALLDASVACTQQLGLTASTSVLERDKLAASYYRLAHAGAVPVGTEH